MNPVERGYATRWLSRQAHHRHLRSNESRNSKTTVFHTTNEVPLCKKHSSAFYRVQKKWKTSQKPRSRLVKELHASPDRLQSLYSLPLDRPGEFVDDMAWQREAEAPAVFSMPGYDTIERPQHGYLDTVLSHDSEAVPKRHDSDDHQYLYPLPSTHFDHSHFHPISTSTSTSTSSYQVFRHDYSPDSPQLPFFSPTVPQLNANKKMCVNYPDLYQPSQNLTVHETVRPLRLPSLDSHSFLQPHQSVLSPLQIQTVTLRNIPLHSPPHGLRLQPIPSAMGDTYIGLLVHNLSISPQFTFRDLLKQLHGTDARIPNGRRLVFTNREMDRQFPIDYPIRQVIPYPHSTHMEFLLGYDDESCTIDWQVLQDRQEVDKRRNSLPQ
ncbi:hypothetical protein CLU79DRAFT_778122 [Phycomyces nitens]|nr:hypothetical protein CLU79DRAFT_778122 [Phycomyces nitens]